MLKTLVSGSVRAGCLGLLLLGSAAQAADYPKMRLRLAHFAPAGWTSSQVDQWFADEVAKRSDGAVKIEIHWAGELGNALEIVDQVTGGGVALGATAGSYYPTRFPLSGMTNAVFMLFRDVAVAMDTQADLIANVPALTREFESQKIVPVLNHGLAPYRLQCTRPVRTMADLSGIRVRTFGNYAPTLAKFLGMVPVNLQLNDLYDSLKRGIVDCVMLNNEVGVALKLHEVARHWSTINFGALSGYTLYASWTNWTGAWPREVVDLFKTVAAEARTKEMADVAAAEERAAAWVRTVGVTIDEFEDQEAMVAVAPDLLKQWAETVLSQGAKPEDVQAIVQRVQRKMTDANK